MLLRLPLDDVDLAHPMWLVLRQELRERQVITGERVDAVEHHAPGNAVIPVGGVEVVRAVWTLGDDEVRPPLPDLTADVEPEAARVLELTIVVAEELNVFHAERDLRDPLGRAGRAQVDEVLAVGRAAVHLDHVVRAQPGGIERLQDLRARELPFQFRKRRRRHLKQELAENPQDAPFSKEDVGKFRSADFDAMDQDATRKQRNQPKGK